jgi:hypothetical protein
MRFVGLILLVITLQCASAQKYELIERSNYQHNYQVTKAVIVESPADTAALQYIATIQISEAHEHLNKSAGWIDLIRIKAREYGANCYSVSKFVEDETMVSLTLKYYFGSLKFLERNALKQETTKAIVFNQTRMKGDTALFFHNRKAENFDSMRFAEIRVTEKKLETIATNRDDATAIHLIFKKKAKARYFILPARKSSYVLNNNKINPNAPVLTVGGIPISFRLNEPYELNYQTGRLLQELYGR